MKPIIRNGIFAVLMAAAAVGLEGCTDPGNRTEQAAAEAEAAARPSRQQAEEKGGSSSKPSAAPEPQEAKAGVASSAPHASSSDNTRHFPAEEPLHIPSAPNGSNIPHSLAEPAGAKSVAISGAGHAESAIAPIPAAPVLAKPVSPNESAPTAKTKEAAHVVRIPVLNYHSIGHDPDNNAVIEPRMLEEQMAYLAREGYTTLTLRQFIEIWEGVRPVPPKAVLLTFDDGYADNYELALPILKKYGFHATMFMSPGSVGDGWYIDWQQAKELMEAGWDIQPHGMTHPYLNKLSAEKQKEEITEAARQIEEHLGVRSEVFCYPYGVYNKDTLNILTEQGFKLAFTIDQGFADTMQHRFKLKRQFIGGQDSMNAFIQKLTKG